MTEQQIEQPLVSLSLQLQRSNHFLNAGDVLITVYLALTLESWIHHKCPNQESKHVGPCLQISRKEFQVSESFLRHGAEVFEPLEQSFFMMLYIMPYSKACIWLKKKI